MARILIVDNENDLCNVIADILTGKGYNITIALNEHDVYLYLKKYLIDLILLDISLSTGNQEGFDILEYCKQNLPNLPVVIMSANDKEDYAIQAIKQGAVDFLSKPFSAQRLLLTIEQQLHAAEQKRAMNQLQESQEETIVADSEMMIRVMNMLEKDMRSKTTLAFVGDQGTGKSFMARYVHSKTASKQSRLLVLNCSKIKNDKELTARLIGKTANNGLLFEAVGGTLVLDKAECLNADVQHALHNLLASLSKGTVNLKIISLFNSSIYQRVRDLSFSKELFDKLSGLLIGLPLLKSRFEDLGKLIAKFAQPYTPQVNEEVIKIFHRHTWPGNLHELKNIVEQMTIQDKEHLTEQNINRKIGNMNDPTMLTIPYKDALQKFTEQYFLALLDISDGNQTIAANKAGVDRSTLYRKIERTRARNELASDNTYHKNNKKNSFNINDAEKTYRNNKQSEDDSMFNTQQASNSHHIWSYNNSMISETKSDKLEKTFCIIKPDAMAKHAEQEIKNLITASGLVIAQEKKLQLSDEQIDDLYVEHKAKSFYPEIKEFMSSGDVIALELEGEDAVAKLRKIMGATNSAEAEEGTIRCQFGDKTNIMKNCVHGSDSIESAQREIGIVF